MNSSVSHLRAIGFALAGFTFWVFGDVTMKLAGGVVMPKHEIMTISCISGMAVILAVTLPYGQLGKLKPKRPISLFLLGFFYSCNYLCMVWALPHISMSNFYIIVFMSPITIAILAALFLHEHLKRNHVLAILAGFIGVIIAVNPMMLFQDTDHALVYGAVFACMILNALQMLLLRILGPYETRECTVLSLRTVGLACSLGLGFFYGFEPVPFSGLAYAVASGIFGGIGWLSMAHAYKLAPAATVAPFHYSQLLVGGLLGYLIWGEAPTMHMLLGATIIVGSGLYIAMHARKTKILAGALAESADT